MFKRLYENPLSSRYKKDKNLTERTLYVLLAYEKYEPMSSNAAVETINSWGSFEDIHNAVHLYVGGNGHMGDIGVSAFDPLFWCHHT